MDAPPVHYVTTSDGVSIAYAISGSGSPLLFPSFPNSDIRSGWKNSTSSQWLERLIGRFQVIQYDSRGQGLSSRGLREDHSMADYGHDVEAIVSHLKLDQFLFLGCNYFGHVAVRYAVEHPALVRGLILTACAPSMASWPGALESLAEQNWDIHLRAHIVSLLPPTELVGQVARFREATTQEDHKIIARAFMASDITEILPHVRTPALVLHAPSFPFFTTEDATKLAAGIPAARLVLIDGPAPAGDFNLNMAAIDQFVFDLAAPDGTPPQARTASPRGDRSARDMHANEPVQVPAESLPVPQRPTNERGHVNLTSRQEQVLLLIARGMTSREIAHELVLSERTVQRHIADVYAKLGVRNRAEATAVALNEFV